MSREKKKQVDVELSFMQKCNAKPANVEIKPVALHEAYKIPVI